MGLTKHSALRVEQLEDRALLSASVVLEWNQDGAGRHPGDGHQHPSWRPAPGDHAGGRLRRGQRHRRDLRPVRLQRPGAPDGLARGRRRHRRPPTLVELFPTRRAVFDAALASSLADVPDGPAENQGVAVGRAAAQSILALRRTTAPTRSCPTRPAPTPATGSRPRPRTCRRSSPQWPEVTPFAMTSGAQFRPSAPPALTSASTRPPSTRSSTSVATPAPPAPRTRPRSRSSGGTAAGTSFAFGHWNIIAQEVAAEQERDLVGEARLFARLNIAMADAVISTWDAKYEYDFWRPVTAIRAADTDGNPDTTADTTWTPLLGTPNFPSYTSAHSTVSAAAAAILTDLFGSGYQFTTGSEGLAGVTRTFDSFEEAAAEAGQSRVFGGIHLPVRQRRRAGGGAELGKYVLTNFLLPRDDGDDLLTAAAPAPAPVNVTLSADQVQPLLAEALAALAGRRRRHVGPARRRGPDRRPGRSHARQGRRRDHLAGRRRGRVGLVRRFDAVGRLRVRRARRSGRSRGGWTCSRHSSTRSATCSVTTTRRRA